MQPGTLHSGSFLQPSCIDCYDRLNTASFPQRFLQVTLATQGLLPQPGRRGQDPLGASRQHPTLQAPTPRRLLPASHHLQRRRRKRPIAMTLMKQVGSSGGRGVLGIVPQKPNPVGQDWESRVSRHPLTPKTWTCTFPLEKSSTIELHTLDPQGWDGW